MLTCRKLAYLEIGTKKQQAPQISLSTNSMIVLHKSAHKAFSPFYNLIKLSILLQSHTLEECDKDWHLTYLYQPFTFKEKLRICIFFKSQSIKEFECNLNFSPETSS